MAKTEKKPVVETAKSETGVFDLEGKGIPLPDLELMPTEGYAGSDWASNFDPTSDEHIEKTFLTQDKGDIEVGSDTSKRFLVKFWAVQRHRRFKDDEGNTTVGVTLSLFTVDGKLLVVTSDVVLRFWKMGLGMRGVGPWEKGLPVGLVEGKSGAGRRLFKLRLLSSK